MHRGRSSLPVKAGIFIISRFRDFRRSQVSALLCHRLLLTHQKFRHENPTHLLVFQPFGGGIPFAVQLPHQDKSSLHQLALHTTMDRVNDVVAGEWNGHWFSKILLEVTLFKKVLLLLHFIAFKFNIS